MNSVLDSIQKQIDELVKTMQTTLDRINLLDSSFASGNYQPFGAYTVEQENAIKPQLKAERDLLSDKYSEQTKQKAALLKQYAETKASLTNPVEQQALLAAEQTALTKAIAENNKILAQGTTKYLIWGAVVLVIIVIGVIIYRKKFAK